MGFMDLEKAYGRVNREALRQILRVYDVGGKLLNGIKIHSSKTKITRARGPGPSNNLIHSLPLQLEYVSELKYLAVLDESGTDDAECRRRMASMRKVAGDIWSLVNVRGL